MITYRQISAGTFPLTDNKNKRIKPREQKMKGLVDLNNRGKSTFKIILVALISIAVIALGTFIGITVSDSRKKSIEEAERAAYQAEFQAGADAKRCKGNQRTLATASAVYYATNEVITTLLDDLEPYSGIGVTVKPTPDCNYEYAGNDDNLHAWRCTVESHDIHRDETP